MMPDQPRLATDRHQIHGTSTCRSFSVRPSLLFLNDLALTVGAIEHFTFDSPHDATINESPKTPIATHADEPMALREPTRTCNPLWDAYDQPGGAGKGSLGRSNDFPFAPS
jgi:hypothetical protein